MSSPSARTQRFFIEFVIITVVAQAAATAVMSRVEAAPYGIALRLVVTALAGAVSQWFVLRRYVPWAQWWAPATLLGQNLLTSSLATLVFRGVFAVSDSREVAQQTVNAAFGLALALAQYPTLHRRVARAWLWLVALPLAYLLSALVTVMAFPNMTGVESGFSLIARTTTRYAVLAIVEGATLAWLLRPWLERDPPPVSRAFTRLEFLIAWCAVPAATFAIVSAASTSTSSGRPMETLYLLTLLFVALLAAGQLWVLAGTGVDQRRWGAVTLLGSLVFLLLNFLTNMAAGIFYMVVLMTRAGGIGLVPALAQTFAVRTTRVLWVIAALIGWTAGYWIPMLVHTVVGPANSYRYAAYSEPVVVGLIAGLLTGLALLPEVKLDRG